MAAAGVIIVMAIVSSASAPTACGGLSPSYPPIIAFELARSEADLFALFGDAPGPCRDAMIRAMDVTNVGDLLVFMPTYGLFLLAALRMLARSRGEASAGSALVAAVLVGDALENACLLALTPDLDPGSWALALLPWATGLKWLLLAATSALAAAWLAREGTASKVGAALSLAAPLTVALALWDPSRFGATITSGIVLSWMVLLVLAVSRAR